MHIQDRPARSRRWAPLDRSEVRRAWNWRSEVTQQVINTDIDGLITGALLHHLKGWPVVGFFDTETLWLAEDAAVPLDLERTAWVDIDMCWPGTRSLSQHVITIDSKSAHAVDAHASTVNPNLFVGCHAGATEVYQRKYPFGTFQWAAWIAGSPAPPHLDEALLTGLAWMPDGGFQSVNHPSWRSNCLSWATSTLAESLLSPLAQAGTQSAGSLVEAAAHRLAAAGRLPATWQNWQYVMSRVGPRSKILVDVATASGLPMCKRCSIASRPRTAGRASRSRRCLKYSAAPGGHRAAHLRQAGRTLPTTGARSPWRSLAGATTAGPNRTTPLACSLCARPSPDADLRRSAPLPSDRHCAGQQPAAAEHRCGRR